jgi:hypothetical protein
MHNLCAAKSTGFCLCALIGRRCFEGMLELDRDGVVERRIILNFGVGRGSKIAPRFRHVWGLTASPVKGKS